MMKTTTVRYPLENRLGRGIQNSDEPIALYIACREAGRKGTERVKCQLLAEPILVYGHTTTDSEGTVNCRYWLVVVPVRYIDEETTILRRDPIEMVFYVGIATWEEVLKDYYSLFSTNS
jgi:hypothetical protein